MSRLRLSSILPVSYRDELERIVFFNPEQGRYLTPLLAAVNRYGVPVIHEEAGCLRLGVPAFRAVQTLYVFDGQAGDAVLAGAAMFVRENDDTMLVLHLAVHQDFTGDGPQAHQWAALRLMSAIRDISMRTRGVSVVRVLYPRETRFTLRAEAIAAGSASKSKTQLQSQTSAEGPGRLIAAHIGEQKPGT